MQHLYQKVRDLTSSYTISKRKERSALKLGHQRFPGWEVKDEISQKQTRLMWNSRTNVRTDTYGGAGNDPTVIVAEELRAYVWRWATWT